MLRWFRALLPREERFFDLFARHSQTVLQGALALQDMLRGGAETPVFCQRVNQFENDADNITREVLTAVRRTFITPFDRGDIKNLITSMDDAIDQMQQTAKAVILFEVRTFEPPMREMGTLLVECANLVGRALPLLQSIGDNVAMLTAITEELTKLEGPWTISMTSASRSFSSSTETRTRWISSSARRSTTILRKSPTASTMLPTRSTVSS